MPPKRKCSSKHHDYCCSLSPNEQEIIHRICDRKIKKSVIDFLLKRQHIFPHSTYLCNLCAKFAEQCIKYEAEAEEAVCKRTITVLDYFDEFLEAIQNNKLSLDQLSSLAHAIGKFYNMSKTQIFNIIHIKNVILRNAYCVNIK
jgi:hypothetical protein